MCQAGITSWTVLTSWPSQLQDSLSWGRPLWSVLLSHILIYLVFIRIFSSLCTLLATFTLLELQFDGALCVFLR